MSRKTLDVDWKFKKVFKVFSLSLPVLPNNQWVWPVQFNWNSWRKFFTCCLWNMFWICLTLLFITQYYNKLNVEFGEFEYLFCYLPFFITFRMNLNIIIIGLDSQFVWRVVPHIQDDYKAISVHSHLCKGKWQTEYCKRLKTCSFNNVTSS